MDRRWPVLSTNDCAATNSTPRANFDAEILSALGRLHRSSHLTTRQTTVRIEQLANSPVRRHELSPLVVGAWKRRHNLRLVDALYAELSESLDLALVTTDRGLAAAFPPAELIARP